MAGSIPSVTLNSGQKMPVLGLGTAAASMIPNLESCFLDAIQVGYRHFDTAAIYGTEQPLGVAIAEALRRGLIHSRDELFVTSKLWCTDTHPDHVLPALKKSLKNLGLDYLDLYLIHWPVRLEHGEHKFPIIDEVILPFDMAATWRAMEECHELGLAKSIGVSNFSSKKLSQLLANSRIPPAVNQVEMNTSWNQKKLRELCEENGVHITAYSPLAAYNTPYGSASVMENPTLKAIANAKGKPLAQVALRWLYEQKVSLVVKSHNKGRMEENMKIFGWELSLEDNDLIGKLPQKKAVLGEEFVSLSGPYRSTEELWDGEV
ncbi:non-functional NADPH-dependent codeinone reductase 2-like [Typha angustifolia]|uniref:non-functional NADPH-dependent codeinone reductase 2-like n=1 Tax=Typha angustifolia TaxID=59011 RepID=UPI003C2B7CC5